MSLLIDNIKIDTIHFSGIYGSGMSALAQFLAWQGLSVSGSDRSYNQDATRLTHEKLTEAGCIITQQDGTALTSKVDALCISTAIEHSNPEILAAEKLGIPIFHRSDVLASLVKMHKTIAVAGTSGKSTVTAMIFEFLTACNKSPSLISGAPLLRLERQGYLGNAFYGLSDLLVIEADESDGTLVKYTPEISVILNVSKDHKDVAVITDLFKVLSSNSGSVLVNLSDNNLNAISSLHTFSLDNHAATWCPDTYNLTSEGSSLTRGEINFTLPVPGLHNASNCAAALAVCEKLGCSANALQKAVASFEGVSRRFAITRTKSGVIVVDDFAHNPDKIRAAVTTARLISDRIIAIYQPHGFGPTRFLRNEYKELFPTIFNKDDLLYLLPIYFAGGTAIKDISSTDLKNDVDQCSFMVTAPIHRDDILKELPTKVASGNCVLLMGARDPSLAQFAGSIVSLFS